jgi:SAM-dependent methyltransferase
VETTRIVEIHSLNVIGENRAHAVHYEPSGSVGNILRELRIAYEQYGFVDFGSGKGRVLLQAAAFPFRTVEGVEFSIEMHKIAERNIRRYRRAKVRCGSVRSILADAAEFSLPTIPLVLYFHNPFSESVLAPVIFNICRSAAAHPRDVILLWAGRWGPKEVLDRIPGIRILWSQSEITAYRLAP